MHQWIDQTMSYNTLITYEIILRSYMIIIYVIYGVKYYFGTKAPQIHKES